MRGLSMGCSWAAGRSDKPLSRFGLHAAWLEPLVPSFVVSPASPPRTLPVTPLTPTHPDAAMSSFAARSAFRAAPRLRAAAPARRWASNAAASDSGHAERQAGKDALKTGAKRDPELYVCGEPLRQREMQLEAN